MPLEPHDRLLDIVITEAELIRTQSCHQGLIHASSLPRRYRRAARPQRGRSSACPALRERWQLDCVVINGENSAGGFGITEAICDELLAAGADAITLGNHSWDQRETLVFIERQPRLLRPVNYPARHARARREPHRYRTPASASSSSTSWAASTWTRSTIPSPRSTGSSSLPARAGGRCGHRRRARGGDEREGGHGPLSRRARQPGRRHPHPCADRRSPGPARRHRLYVRCGHVRRLRFRARHAEGGIDPPLPPEDARPAHGARPSARARSPASRSRPTTAPGLADARRGCPARAATRRDLAALLGLRTSSKSDVLSRPSRSLACHNRDRPMLCVVSRRTPRWTSAIFSTEEPVDADADEAGQRIAQTSEFHRAHAHQSASAVLRAVIDEAKGETISIGEIIEAFGERAFGFVLILFSLPNCVPAPPGIAGIVGTPVLIFGIQMMLGHKRPWLPGFILRRTRLGREVQAAHRYRRAEAPEARELLPAAAAPAFRRLRRPDGRRSSPSWSPCRC